MPLLTSNIIPSAPLTQGAPWFSTLSHSITTGLARSLQSIANTGSKYLSGTSAVRMGADITPTEFKSVKTPTRTAPDTRLETASTPVVDNPESIPVLPPPTAPPQQSPSSFDPVEVYKSFQGTIDLMLRFVAQWAAAPFMYSSGKELVGSVYFRGEQPETFGGVCGNPFKEMTPPADPMDWRYSGAFDRGVAYLFWIPANFVSICLDTYLLRELERRHQGGQITSADYESGKKIIKSCLLANKFMLADTALFVGSFLYMSHPEHSEAVGLPLLVATQVGNVVAHAAMLRRNDLVIRH
ncbi:MAG TPA: hypothetical protein VJC18_05915, partial [bacterium]|nr:hypothetical protein [bacterium]